MTSPEWSDERAQLHGKMLSAVSHDLKTPLASIIGSLEIYQQLAATLPAEKRVALIRTALEEAYRLDSFMTNVLDMMRLEEGLTVARPTHESPVELVRQAMGAVAPRFPDRQIRVQADGAPPDVTADRQLVARAIALLLENALKYAPRSEVEVEISGMAKSVNFIVRDSGPGVPPEQHEAIFAKYVRAQQPEGAPPVSGLGLGLSIARVIARMHKGDVLAAKRKGGGMEFTLSLPA